jgi:hypothetical protein
MKNFEGFECVVRRIEKLGKLRQTRSTPKSRRHFKPLEKSLPEREY